MNNKIPFAVSLVALLVLAACGGGGGSDSPTTAPTTTTQTNPTAPATPTVTGEQLPSLSSPQTGSTASVGNGVEGIWSTTSGADKTTALIDPQYNVSYLNSTAGFVTSLFFGVLAPSSTNWTLTSGDEFISNIYYPTTSGSGTFANNQTFSGSYTTSNGTVNLSWTYDPANALAVTQSSVAGTWTESNASLTIASDGTLTGTLSSCPVTGTLLLTAPSSNKNMFSLSVTGTNASCQLKLGTTYSGNAAITFLPISGSTLYTRSILYAIRAADNSTFAYGQLSKQ